MNDSLVLLPTYCESRVLPQVLERLSGFDEVDVLVIDDSSPDGTGELAEALKGRYARLSVLHRARKEGLGRAYAHGFREALRRGYRRVVTMDADLSHAPEDVPRLLEGLGRADVSVGSRHVPGGGVEGWPLSRRLLSRSGSLYARTLLRLPVRDVTGGFRAYRAEVLEELDLAAIEARGFLFQVEVLRRALDLPGTRAVEVPIVFRNRKLGESKLSRDIVLEALRGVVKLRRRKRPIGRTRGRARRREDSPHSPRPLVSVIVPHPPGSGRPRVLRAIRALDYPEERLEVLVSEGTAPSRQRNRAVCESRGEYLLFLDEDSEPEEDLLARYVDLLERRPGVAAVGGPAEAKAGATEFQELSQSVLSDPRVVGKTASRYRRRGELRESDERELILCNLCLRRSAFEECGGFDERLYPNEENALLERLRRAGWKLIYDPGAVVRRPPRESLGEYARSIYRYGRGRGAQVRFFPSRVSLVRMLWVGAGAALILLAFSGALLSSALAWALPLGGYVLYLALLALRSSRRLGLGTGFLAAGMAAITHSAYGLGALRGVLGGGLRQRESAVRIERLDVADERKPGSAGAPPKTRRHEVTNETGVLS